MDCRLILIKAAEGFSVGYHLFFAGGLVLGFSLYQHPGLWRFVARVLQERKRAAFLAVP